MNTSIKRRIFLKGSMAAGAVSVAVGAGLLAPRAVMAAWPTSAFEAKSTGDALNALLGTATPADSGDIKIKAPDIAENGAVVPVTITAPGAESIALLAAGNGTPLLCSAVMGEGTEGFLSTRIKMGKTSDVIAVVKAGGKVVQAKKSVKVTIGGCGG